MTRDYQQFLKDKALEFKDSGIEPESIHPTTEIFEA